MYFVIATSFLRHAGTLRFIVKFKIVAENCELLYPINMTCVVSCVLVLRLLALLHQQHSESGVLRAVQRAVPESVRTSSLVRLLPLDFRPRGALAQRPAAALPVARCSRLRLRARSRRERRATERPAATA